MKFVLPILLLILAAGYAYRDQIFETAGSVASTVSGKRSMSKAGNAAANTLGSAIPNGE